MFDQIEVQLWINSGMSPTSILDKESEQVES